MRLASGNILSFKKDLPILGFQQTGDEIEECCLPGAVRTDDCHNLAFLNVKVGPLNRLEFAERFG
jgi:hypothetical protein